MTGAWYGPCTQHPFPRLPTWLGSRLGSPSAPALQIGLEENRLPQGGCSPPVTYWWEPFFKAGTQQGTTAWPAARRPGRGAGTPLGPAPRAPREEEKCAVEGGGQGG